MRRLSMTLVACAILAMPIAGRATTAAKSVRTVYFSARDASGAQVTDLTAADLAVKEGGKDRVIKDVNLATEPLQVSLIVDDGGTGGFQAAVAQFIDALLAHAQFAVRVLNPQPSRIADFTNDAGALRAATNGIGPRGRVYVGGDWRGDQIIEAIEDAARELHQRKAARPAIVVMTVETELAQFERARADAVLNALKESGASLSVIGLGTGPVLGDGPKRSGGVIYEFGSHVVPGPVLAKVADNLLHQYVLTYTLPDGVKPNERFALTTSRKGVTLIAPNRVSDE